MGTMYTMKFHKRLLAVLFIFLVFTPSGIVRSAGPGPLDLIAEVNAYRQAQGLTALEVDDILMRIAQNQSVTMVSTSRDRSATAVALLLASSSCSSR